MELPLVAPLQREQWNPTLVDSPAPPPSRQLSPAAPLTAPKPRRVLHFDLETVAAGFGDPEWVPQKITAVAWSWADEETIHARVCGPYGVYGRPHQRASMLGPVIDAIRMADMVSGHNIVRFDLPVLNGECLRLGLEPLPRLVVQDTIRLVRTKGFKKGQDNLGALLGLQQQKLSLNWQEWDDAYDGRRWETVKLRAVSDVRQNKQMREEMLARGWLLPPRPWNPKPV